MNRSDGADQLVEGHVLEQIRAPALTASTTASSSSKVVRTSTAGGLGLRA